MVVRSCAARCPGSINKVAPTTSHFKLFACVMPMLDYLVFSGEIQTDADFKRDNIAHNNALSQ